MKKYQFAFSVFILSNIAFAESSCIEKKCGEPPSYLLLDQKGAELKKAEEIFSRFNKCVYDCGGDEKAKIGLYTKPNIYVKEKDDLAFCEKMLPKVLKDSYDEKMFGLTNITKTSPSAKELNQMVMDRVKEKKALCQSHLDGKFDSEIYPKKMSELKFCFERMKDAKVATKEFDQFQKVKIFIENRVKKVMLDSSRSADLINVQNKLDDCKQSMADHEAAQLVKSNQSDRLKLKNVPVDETDSKGSIRAKSIAK